MSFPETVDEILDVSEDEGRRMEIFYLNIKFVITSKWTANIIIIEYATDPQF